jgi:hypothetical protein
MLNAASILLKRLDGLMLRATLGAAIVNERGEPWRGGAGDPVAQGYRYYIPSDRDAVTYERLGKCGEIVYYKGNQPRHSYRAHAKSSLLNILNEGTRREPETQAQILNPGDGIIETNFVTLQPLETHDNGSVSDSSEDAPLLYDNIEAQEWSADDLIEVAKAIARIRYRIDTPTVFHNITGYTVFSTPPYDRWDRITPVYIHFYNPDPESQCTNPRLEYHGDRLRAVLCHRNGRQVECNRDQCELIDGKLNIQVYATGRRLVLTKLSAAGAFAMEIHSRSRTSQEPVVTSHHRVGNFTELIEYLTPHLPTVPAADLE